jgi:hypothetical protein
MELSYHQLTMAINMGAGKKGREEGRKEGRREGRAGGREGKEEERLGTKKPRELRFG